MSTLAAAGPVTEAIFGVLNDATLQAAVDGRVFDDLPADVARPCILLEIFQEENIRSVGTTGPRKLEGRTHVFSDLGSMSEAKSLDAQIVALLDLAVPTVTGFAMCGTVWTHESVTLSDQALAGVKVHEVVGIHSLIVEVL